MTNKNKLTESNRYYTLRIRIAGSERVTLEIRDPENRSINEVAGKLGFSGENREQVLQLLDQARRAELTAEGAEELGNLLFSILFDDTLRREFLQIYRKAQDDGALLRMELDVDETGYPEIASLPWEFMFVPPGADSGALWLATSPNMVLCRRRVMGKVPEPIQLEKGERLRIALAVAAPETLGRVHYKPVLEALEELSLSVGFDLVATVNPANRGGIDSALEKKPHIFHFIGHGRLEDKEGRETGQVALVDSMGGEDWVSAHNFGELFNRHRPGLVVLQSCETGALSSSKALAGIASQVVQQDIPAVTAMQFEVSNATAKRFALEFYRRLANNEPVDKAAQEGRRKIALESGYDSRDFATPVLFMRVLEGRLFQRAEGDTVTPVSAQPVGGVDIKSLMAKLTFKLNDIGMQLFTDVANRLNKIESESPEDGGEQVLGLLKEYLDGGMDVGDFKERWENYQEDSHQEQQAKGPDYKTLAQRLNRGEIIPFLGSGTLELSGYPVPSSPEMVQKMAEKVDYPQFQGSLSMLSQYCKSEKKYSRGMIISKVKETMTDLKQERDTNPLYDILAGIEAPILVISSSYDDHLVHAFREKRKKYVVLSHYFLSASDIADGKMLIQYDNRRQPEEPCSAESISSLKLLEDGYSIIYKICGYFNMEEPGSRDHGDEPIPLMIMENDFFSFSRKLEQLIPPYITKKFPRLGFLFFGYNLDQWQDRLIADTMLERCPKEEDSFTVSDDPQPYEWAFWKTTHKMVLYREKLDEFVEKLAPHIQPAA
jgi:hypothetical protein